ncbi:hypothetical protein C8Q74DRAFT_134689 [Fomes fomentarius]|nr:hypothetical protein C8Q74DRAFT_134689 [Fomes fomentarius]
MWFPSRPQNMEVAQFNATGNWAQFLLVNAANGDGFVNGVDMAWPIGRLSGMLFVILTLCTISAAFMLSRKGLRRLSTTLLLVALTMMYASACVSWALHSRKEEIALRTSAEFGRNVLGALICSLIEAKDPVYCAVENERHNALHAFASFENIHDCAATTALTVNVILGDTIVWWRVWSIWQGNCVVRVLGIFLILGTAALGIADTTHSCMHTHRSSVALASGNFNSTFPVGTLYQGDGTGMATCVISLVTNIAATALVAYKAWTHWRLIAKHLRLCSGRSQAERVLALIVESGVVYCVIWTLIVGYQLSLSHFKSTVGSTQNIFENIILHTSSNSTNSSPTNHFQLIGANTTNPIQTEAYERYTVDPFVHGFQFFIQGGLNLTIAIYPTVIILLVGLDKSYYDRGGFSLGRIDCDGPALPTTMVYSTVFRDRKSNKPTHQEAPDGDSLKDSEEVNCGDMGCAHNLNMYNVPSYPTPLQ